MHGENSKLWTPSQGFFLELLHGCCAVWEGVRSGPSRQRQWGVAGASRAAARAISLSTLVVAGSGAWEFTGTTTGFTILFGFARSRPTFFMDLRENHVLTRG